MKKPNNPVYSSSFSVGGKSEKTKVPPSKKDEIPDNFNKPYNHSIKDPLDIEKYTRWYKRKFRKSSIMLINMELRNGSHMSMFMTTGIKGSFRWKKRTYLIFPDAKYYHIDAGCYAIDYHEDISIPVKRNIDVMEIKKGLKGMQKFYNSDMAINPSLLDEFIKAEIAQGLMKAGEIDKFMRQLRLVSIISMITIIGFFLIWAYRTGMFGAVTGVVTGGG